MASTVTAIYNPILKQVVAVIVDATNLADPSYNPPDCIQIPIDAVTYNESDNQQIYAFIQSVVDNLELKNQ